MEPKPLFSIIIPTFNCAQKLNRALESIQNQKFKDFEVIVCDDGSTDRTKEIVESYSKKLHITYQTFEHWGGPSRPRNNGILIAKGKYIAFLDADDWWKRNKLEVVSEHLDNHDILYHDLDIYTPKGKKRFKKVKGRRLKVPVFVDLMRNENCLITSSVVVKKSIIEAAGGFTESFLTCVEDFDLWLRIAGITDDFYYIPQNLGAYWIDTTNGNVSKASGRIIERLQFVYQKHSQFLGAEDKKQAEAILSYLLGRTKLKIGLTKEALELFKKSTKSSNIKFKVRSTIWIFLIYLKLQCQKD